MVCMCTIPGMLRFWLFEKKFYIKIVYRIYDFIFTPPPSTRQHPHENLLKNCLLPFPNIDLKLCWWSEMRDIHGSRRFSSANTFWASGTVNRYAFSIATTERIGCDICFVPILCWTVRPIGSYYPIDNCKTNFRSQKYPLHIEKTIKDRSRVCGGAPNNPVCLTSKIARMKHSIEKLIKP